MEVAPPQKMLKLLTLLNSGIRAYIHAKALMHYVFLVLWALQQKVGVDGWMDGEDTPKRLL